MLNEVFNNINNAPIIKQHSSKIFVYQNKTLVIEFPVTNGTVGIDLDLDAEGIRVSLVGRDKEVQRTLRNCYLGKYELRQISGERLIVKSGFTYNSSDELISFLISLINETQYEFVRHLAYDLPDKTSTNVPVAVFWWDHIANFGDLIGPLVVADALKVEPFNARQRLRPGNTLYSVGSVTAMIDRDDVTIWGSGLLAPLSDRQIVSLRRRKNVEVLAVRGRYTQLELEAKLGWNVPPVFGDPALLLPRFYEPRRTDNSGGTAVVMHWEHAKYVQSEGNDDLNIVNVGDDARYVIDQIANANVCVSTSLHGIIVAQAYGIPWVWLQISDHKLHSSDFKFDDFFTTIKRIDASKTVLSKTQISTLDWKKIAATASLPETIVDLDELLDALKKWPTYGRDDI